METYNVRVNQYHICEGIPPGIYIRTCAVVYVEVNMLMSPFA